MSGPREVELKFEVLPGKAAALRTRRLERLGGGEGLRERLVSTYFDTPKHVLRRNGLTLRVRAGAEKRLQTIKEAARSGAGLFERGEWESEVGTDTPDLAAAKGTPVDRVLSERAAAALRPVFTTDVNRTTWLVHTDGAEIEAALDEGTVTANGATRVIAELELELKRGRPADLFAMVRDLGGADLLRLGVATKSERGYSLALDEGPAAFKAEPVALARGMSAADAVAAIVRSCIRQLSLNEALVVTTRSADALHQARVGMRRLRSALSLFGGVVGDESVGGLRRRLGTISDRLGEARNLDVYLARLARGEGLADPAERERTVATLSAEREAAYDRVSTALGSKRYRGLMLELLAWSEAGAWRSSAAAERPIEKAASAILRKRRRRVKRSGRHLDRKSPTERHDVRIAVKKLRYASEFLAGLVEKPRERRRHRAFLQALEGLQECLGELNDIETGLAIGVAAGAKAGGSVAAPAITRPAERDEAREAALVASAMKAHRAFADAKPFWKDLA